MSEKIGGAKGTELDDDFILMEKVCALLFFGCTGLKRCTCNPCPDIFWLLWVGDGHKKNL